MQAQGIFLAAADIRIKSMIEISDLIGVKFTPHGRTKKEGFDCYGLAIEVLSRVNKRLPDVFYDSVEPDANRQTAEHIEDVQNYFNLELITELENYCIILMSRNTRPHIAVYLGNNKIIHCTETNGVVVQNYDRIKARVNALYRVGD